ncbi:MAG: MBL fold metallo-hydrolase [Gemmatimonadales bacterium]
MTLTARCWGARGSIPAPGSSTAKAGGNTPCIAVDDGQGHCLILDAGSGLRLLGRAFDPLPEAVTLLLSHTHWDHIQGLPFFAPLYRPGFHLTVLGPERTAPSLDQVIDLLLDPAFFPVPRSALAGSISASPFGNEPREIDGFLVEATPLCHPGGALGYSIRLATGHRGISYMTDNELAVAKTTGTWTNLVRFLHQTHTLVHDAMYFDRQRSSRAGWGHSTVTDVVELATEAGVDRVVLFHHDPTHSDDDLEQLLDEAESRRVQLGGRFDVTLAMEGSTWSC